PNFSLEEKEHIRTGLANALDAEITNSGSDPSATNLLLKKPNVLQILELAQVDPRLHEAMIRRLESEQKSWDVASQEAKRRPRVITAEQRKKSMNNAVDNKATRLVSGAHRLITPALWFTSQQE